MSELVIRGLHDDKTVQQMWTCMGVGDVRAGVLCADGHYGYAQPVGGVIALKGQVSISGVGFDIGCGNMAARLSMSSSDLMPRLDEVSRKIGKTIDFGLGGKRDRSAGWVEHELFDRDDLWQAAEVGHLKEMARAQLGTVGSGNHYVDLFVDEEDHVWIGVHFGSRGLGHKTATKYLAAAGGKDGMDVPPAIVDEKTELGERYLAGMTLAGMYAYAGREWVVAATHRILGSTILDTVHNHHNFAWAEVHDGETLWVVRKGATPAFPGQKGFVGGSMGDNAVILKGIESEESRKNLYSTVHGAGRIMGRVEAKGKKDKTTGEWKRAPRVTRQEMDAWLQEKGVKVVGGDVDESPLVYRRLGEVLAHHAGTVEILHTLRPVLVHMAGNEIRDPYKD
jgi:tRNA-splicing ligase RtcB (3'-phosphate/5'-hydroxy nucleic acid ligase)